MSEQESFLVVDGERIKVTMFTPEGEKKNQAVLFLHGWTGKPNNRAAAFLAEHGYTTMTVVFRGHDGSDGSMETISRQNALDDAKAAYDFLRHEIGADIPICVTGSSYGGYTAAILCDERELNGVSLRVPANYPDEGFELPQAGKGHIDPEVAAWRNKVLDSSATMSLRALHGYDKYVQIFEAELDDLVPHQTLQNYANAVKDKTKLEYHLMKGWPHSLGLDKKRNLEYQKLLLAWLEKL